MATNSLAAINLILNIPRENDVVFGNFLQKLTVESERCEVKYYNKKKIVTKLENYKFKHENFRNPLKFNKEKNCFSLPISYFTSAS